MTLRLYLYAAIALLLAAVGATLYVQHLRITQLQSAQAAQVQHLAQVQRNLDDAKRAQAATDAALSGRITAAQTLLATRKKTNATIQQVLQSQPAAHAWADSPIPDGILGELRQ